MSQWEKINSDDKNDATKENSFYRLDRMKTNFCFGMKMELEFKLTEDGKVRMPGEKAGEYIETVRGVGYRIGEIDAK